MCVELKQVLFGGANSLFHSNLFRGASGSSDCMGARYSLSRATRAIGGSLRFPVFSGPSGAVTASPTIWVHAASMGEVQAGATLVWRLLAQYPDHRVVMTTMTTTGAARVKALFPERVLHCYLPYDLNFAVRRFLDRVRPQSALILETELWPNLLT